MTVQIRFWWPGYTPEDALDSLDPVVDETPFEGRVMADFSGQRLDSEYSDSTVEI